MKSFVDTETSMKPMIQYANAYYFTTSMKENTRHVDRK